MDVQWLINIAGRDRYLALTRISASKEKGLFIKILTTHMIEL